MDVNYVYDFIINNTLVSDEQKQKEKEYKEYVDGHIELVKLAWDTMNKKPLCKEFLNKKLSIGRLGFVDILIQNHDSSKYWIDEWEPYRKNFYPINKREKADNEEAFQKAWEHHYTFNPHHWEHWAYKQMEDQMTLDYVTEMCCDWIVMSNKFGGDALSWYKKQTNIVLGDKQREYAETLLTLYCK